MLQDTLYGTYKYNSWGGLAQIRLLRKAVVCFGLHRAMLWLWGDNTHDLISRHLVKTVDRILLKYYIWLMENSMVGYTGRGILFYLVDELLRHRFHALCEDPYNPQYRKYCLAQHVYL